MSRLFLGCFIVRQVSHHSSDLPCVCMCVLINMDNQSDPPQKIFFGGFQSSMKGIRKQQQLPNKRGAYVNTPLRSLSLNSGFGLLM